MIDPSHLMRLAIDKAREGVAAGESPFGCAIAGDDKVLVVTHNTVLSTTDITAHAEINALREACGQVGDIFLSGRVVASTCEPCPMCMAALHWARVSTVYYGATIADAAVAGFNELPLRAVNVLGGGSPVQLVNGVLVDECRELFEYWRQQRGRRSY